MNQNFAVIILGGTGQVGGPFGSIDQQILGRSIAAEIALHSLANGEVTRENAAMKKLAAELGVLNPER